MTGAIVEADEDFGCGDDFGPGTASVVRAGSATVTRNEVGGSSERLEAVVEVHPTIAGDGKRMRSHMEFADESVFADHD